MKQQTLRKSTLERSAKMRSLAPPLTVRSAYPKGTRQLRVRHTEVGGVCVVKTVVVVTQGRAQLRMAFDPSYYA